MMPKSDVSDTAVTREKAAAKHDREDHHDHAGSQGCERTERPSAHISESDI